MSRKVVWLTLLVVAVVALLSTVVYLVGSWMDDNQPDPELQAAQSVKEKKPVHPSPAMTPRPQPKLTPTPAPTPCWPSRDECERYYALILHEAPAGRCPPYPRPQPTPAPTPTPRWSSRDECERHYPLF